MNCDACTVHQPKPYTVTVFCLRAHVSLPLGDKEEELASNRSDGSESDDSEDEDVDAEASPEDKENLAPNDTSDKAFSEGPDMRKGRKRKRQAAGRARREAQGTAATRRQRIRQYYNGAMHGCASAVQLFAMAMQVTYCERNMCCCPLWLLDGLLMPC